MWKEQQRIVSRAEPELGLGYVLNTQSDSCIEVRFPHSQEVRRYKTKSAPLQRFKLRRGQKAKFKDGNTYEIHDVSEENDLLRYDCGSTFLWEYELDDIVEDQGTLDQFFGKQWSHHNTYELRREAWNIKGSSEKSLVDGMVGPRVTPLAHQLYIANEVSKRDNPRVLLSDEVGLGKTIEAGLILGALKAKEKADRVLIIVPDALVNQWVAEMYRRFGTLFSVVDEERCAQEQTSQNSSAFEANQNVIVSMEFFLNHLDRLEEAVSQKWDLLIIDEAHHFSWYPDDPDPKWLIADNLAKVSKGLLLLTATPQQKGSETQFGLLHLVDPDRFSDFDLFLDEQEQVAIVAKIAQTIQKNGINPKMIEVLKNTFKDDEGLHKLLDQSPDQIDEKEVLANLVDRHGTGRVLFRNRREKLKGFPKRILHSVPLEPSDAYKDRLGKIDAEYLDVMVLMDLATGRKSGRTKSDMRHTNVKTKWLVEFAKNLGDDKAVVICASPEQAIELEGVLSDSTDMKVSLFHKNMNTVDRDREAARFAEPDGASILLCCEIGGEGRNFQFCNKLVLMDLPRHPDLVEQRVGRLDRIGQGKEINIYVPWLQQTPEQALFKWYAEGMKSFEISWNGASALLEEMSEDLIDAMEAFIPSSNMFQDRETILESLIITTKQATERHKKLNQENIDLLIDLNSFDEEKGEELVGMVEDADDDTDIEFYMRSMFDHYGVDYEEFDDRGSLLIKPESLMFIEKFPGIDGNEEVVVTFDRERALEREDFSFLTQDSHIVKGSLNLLLERNEGVACVCNWQNSPEGPGAIIELSMVMQASGPKSLSLGRYLPIQTKEIVVNHHGRQVKDKRYKDNPILLTPLSEMEVPQSMDTLKPFVDSVIAKAFSKADQWTESKIEVAEQKAKKELGAELERLKALAKVNPTISEQEVKAFEKRMEETISCLRKASYRLDGVRLIFTK